MKVDPGERILIIAEAGVNHNGSIDMARQLIRVAAEAGADLVKFQSFRADKLASPSAPKADYQRRTTGPAETQVEMLRKLELSPDDHRALMQACLDQGIGFLSSPFDLDSLDLLLELGVERIKIASGEITNGPLLLKAARSDADIILSTGMASLSEVEQALSVLAFGFVAPADARPTPESLAEAYRGTIGQTELRQRVSLLHCTSDYPAPLEDVNLRAMVTVGDAFGLPVGYSDHTRGIAIPIAAAALGAKVIEKHFTLSKDLPGPDHQASLEPEELAAMVGAVRDVEAALGSPIKFPASSEGRNRPIVRKSLTAKREIGAGEALSPDNVDIRRPGTGFSPMMFWDLGD